MMRKMRKKIKIPENKLRRVKRGRRKGQRAFKGKGVVRKSHSKK